MTTRLNKQIKTQEKILEIAADLFYEKGLQEANIDEIVFQAGITKKTLYKYFASKDQLLVEVVKRSEKLWWDWFIIELNKQSKIAQKQLLIIFDLLINKVDQTSYKNKPFINSKIAVQGKMYPIFLVSDNFVSQLRIFILDIVKLANISKPIEVTEQLLLLVVGISLFPSFDKNITPDTLLKRVRGLARLILKKPKTH